MHFIRSVAWAIVCLGAVGLARESAAASEPLRILSYNIHHGEGVDGRVDLERIARVVLSVKPDIVALQEVDQRAARTGNVDQPAELARLTGMHVVFGKNFDLEGGGYGNAVLSTLPMTLRENLKLPSLLNEGATDDREQRGALVVEVQCPDGETLVVIVTHLDARRPDPERLASATAINEYVWSQGAGRPAVLAGDLNAIPDSAVLERFASSWRNASAAALATVPVEAPRRQIDFVLVRPADRWRTAEARVLEEAVASDHRPLLVVAELRPEP